MNQWLFLHHRKIFIIPVIKKCKQINSFVLFIVSWTCQFSNLIVLCACLVDRSPSWIRGWCIVGTVTRKAFHTLHLVLLTKFWKLSLGGGFYYFPSTEIPRGNSLHNIIEYFNISKYFYLWYFSFYMISSVMYFEHDDDDVETFRTIPAKFDFFLWPIRSPAIITSGRKGESTVNGTMLFSIF